LLELNVLCFLVIEAFAQVHSLLGNLRRHDGLVVLLKLLFLVSTLKLQEPVRLSSFLMHRMQWHRLCIDLQVFPDEPYQILLYVLLLNARHAEKMRPLQLPLLSVFLGLLSFLPITRLFLLLII